jgi:PH domain
LALDSLKVIKEGSLFKKGNIFKRYKDKYLFYLEEPSFLKFGKKDKPLLSCLDLSMASLHVTNDSKTKFKIISPRLTLSLKAESPSERDSWVAALRSIFNKTPMDRDLYMEIDNSFDSN